MSPPTWRMSCPPDQGGLVRNPLPLVMTGPGECASRPGPEKRSPVSLEICWDQSSQRERGPQLFFRGHTLRLCSRDGFSRRVHATEENCTQDCALFWKPPSCFSQWIPSGFAVEGISSSYAEHYSAAEKSRLLGDHRTLRRIMRVSDPRLHKQCGRRISISPLRTRAAKYRACRLLRAIRPKPRD